MIGYWPHMVSISFIATMLVIGAATVTPVPGAAPQARQPGFPSTWSADPFVRTQYVKSRRDMPSAPWWFTEPLADSAFPFADYYRLRSIPFTISFGGNRTDLAVIAAVSMPGDSLSIAVVDAPDSARFAVRCARGRIRQVNARHWVWYAPSESGPAPIAIRELGSDAAICINATVLVPYDGGEYLNGYHIGHYQSGSTDPADARPAGMIEVWPRDLARWVSPHFQLGQFLCRQESGWPKYIVLQTRLLLMLEAMVDELDRRGMDVSTLFVTSGYRTPYYNALIGNETIYSRHTYGDAADVFIDRNGDEMMDDVDGDGAVDADDAVYLSSVVEQITARAQFARFVGGLGIYPPLESRGPFVHVDTRGFVARWTGSDTLEADSTSATDSVIVNTQPQSRDSVTVDTSNMVAQADSARRIDGRFGDTIIPVARPRSLGRRP